MNTKQFVRVAMLTALACVLTIVPKVPIGGGYVHFGDCIIYVAAMILGPIPVSYTHLDVYKRQE